MQSCSNCSAECQDGSKFCQACGHKIESAPAAQAVPAAQAIQNDALAQEEKATLEGKPAGLPLQRMENMKEVNRRLVETYLEHYNSMNIESMLSLFTDNAEFQSVSNTDGIIRTSNQQPAPRIGHSKPAVLQATAPDSPVLGDQRQPGGDRDRLLV